MKMASSNKVEWRKDGQWMILTSKDKDSEE